MSIIYDALQKTQKHRENFENSFNHRALMAWDDWVDVGLALVIAILLSLLIIVHYPKKQVTAVSPQALATQAQQTVDTKLPHTVTIVAAESSEIKAKQLSKTPILPSFDVAQYKSKHLLTGVFISEHEKVALIDNQFYNIGDTVDGMEIIAIEPEQVRLKNKQASLELRLKV